MGLKDSLKNARDGALAKRADAKEKAQRQADKRAADRAAVYASAQASCPMPIEPGDDRLPGGLHLFDDEFLITVGKDWGMSSQKLTLTTHRIVYTHGRVSKDVESVYLTDVKDIRYHRSVVGFGSIVIDTASGKIEGLPASSNGAQLRDRMMQLVHWARQRAQQPQVVQAAAPVGDDIPAQLAKLAQLRDSGVLTDEEFATSKSALLARL
jgi:Short C-terminal domain/Bacterial PH domain